MALDIVLIQANSASLNRINFIIWDQELKSLNHKVSKGAEQYGVDRVGVYLISYDEVVPILIQAQNHPILDRVKWYGAMVLRRMRLL